MSKYYAGIGTRSINNEIYSLIREVCFYLGQEGWTLRSGAASGADTAAEEGADECGGKKEIYLPWKGFNNSQSSLFSPSYEALEMAEKLHPNWAALNQAGQKLIARNCHQILGQDLKTPVLMIVCYTKDGKDSGGTGFGIRMAQERNIPIFNLQRPADRAKIEAKLKTWEETWGEHKK